MVFAPGAHQRSANNLSWRLWHPVAPPAARRFTSKRRSLEKVQGATRACHQHSPSPVPLASTVKWRAVDSVEPMVFAPGAHQRSANDPNSRVLLAVWAKRPQCIRSLHMRTRASPATQPCRRASPCSVAMATFASSQPRCFGVHSEHARHAPGRSAGIVDRGKLRAPHGWHGGETACDQRPPVQHACIRPASNSFLIHCFASLRLLTPSSER